MQVEIQLNMLVSGLSKEEYNPFYQTYISKVQNNELLKCLKENKSASLSILNELSEEQWVKRLKVLEKRREKNKEIYQLMELFKDVGNDVTINIMEIYRSQTPHLMTPGSQVEINGVSVNPTEEVINNIAEIQKMTQYINDKFSEMSKQFNSQFPFINEKWKRNLCYLI